MLPFSLERHTGGNQDQAQEEDCGISMNARIPIYGVAASPLNVTGNRNSQKMAPVVVTITPIRLIQLFEKWTNGESQPPGAGSGLSGILFHDFLQSGVHLRCAKSRSCAVTDVAALAKL